MCFVPVDDLRVNADYLKTLSKYTAGKHFYTDLRDELDHETILSHINSMGFIKKKEGLQLRRNFLLYRAWHWANSKRAIGLRQVFSKLTELGQ